MREREILGVKMGEEKKKRRERWDFGLKLEKESENEFEFEGGGDSGRHCVSVWESMRLVGTKNQLTEI